MLLVAPASADWDVNDPHKMHFPQLPDPNGWDVDFTGRALADDFLCSQSGLITDVHFWGSWVYDEIPEDPNGLQGIGNIVLAIFDNVPAGTASFSRPEEDPLWVYNVGRNFTVRPEAIPSLQGWYEPAIGEETFDANNHNQYFQYNIIIPDANAFYQEANTIYWLGMVVTLEGNPTVADFKIGWKTSTDHWEDDAVWMPFAPNGNSADGNGANNHIGWQELRDPITGASMDLAFVITPEPVTLALLGLGGLVMLGRRRRRA